MLERLGERGLPLPPTAGAHLRPDLEAACAGRAGRWPCALAEGHGGGCVPPVEQAVAARWREVLDAAR